MNLTPRRASASCWCLLTLQDRNSGVAFRFPPVCKHTQNLNSGIFTCQKHRLCRWCWVCLCFASMAPRFFFFFLQRHCCLFSLFSLFIFMHKNVLFWEDKIDTQAYTICLKKVIGIRRRKKMDGTVVRLISTLSELCCCLHAGNEVVLLLGKNRAFPAEKMNPSFCQSVPCLNSHAVFF